MAMQMSFIRFPLKSTTLFSPYFHRVTSASPVVPNLPIHRRSSAAAPPQIQGLELQQAAVPIDGCDYKHWLVIMDPPIGYPLRHQIVQCYLQTLASALGSEEEAKRSMYSVSTKYYYAFGCKIDENVIHRIKSRPNVRWVLPDSHIGLGNNDYGGEPFTDGCVVPYDETFHEDWLQDQIDDRSGKTTHRRRSRRKQQKVNND